MFYKNTGCLVDNIYKEKWIQKVMCFRTKQSLLDLTQKMKLLHSPSPLFFPQGCSLFGVPCLSILEYSITKYRSRTYAVISQEVHRRIKKSH